MGSPSPHPGPWRGAPPRDARAVG
ncbi:hypothetical protein [Cellulomonas sp. APG4]